MYTNGLSTYQPKPVFRLAEPSGQGHGCGEGDLIGGDGHVGDGEHRRRGEPGLSSRGGAVGFVGDEPPPGQAATSDTPKAVLDEAREYADTSGLLLASSTGKPLSNTATSKLLKENGVEAVTHGFRSSFRDWCADSGVSASWPSLRSTTR